METGRFDVFLSHNSSDKQQVETLAERLRGEGVEPWLDSWHLIPGEPFQPAIEHALRQCATCAVFIGPSGVSPWQNEEMQAAIRRRVAEPEGRVIPVLLPGAERGARSALPDFLAGATWVDFRRSLDEAESFRRLLCGIQGIAPGPRQALYPGECPYRGLAAFQERDTRFFSVATPWSNGCSRPCERHVFSRSRARRAAVSRPSPGLA